MTTHDTEVRWPKRWSCSEARDNEFAEQSGPDKPIMAVRNGVTIGTVDLCPKCYETFCHHAARPDQPPFAPGQTVRDTRTGKQHNVARCENRVVHGALRWIVDDHNGSRAFADDCVLVHAGTLTTEAVAALVAKTEHCFKPLEPSPVRYACSKLAAVGDTVKFVGRDGSMLLKVTAISTPDMCHLEALNGKWGTLCAASSLEFVPDVTPNKLRETPFDPVAELELEQLRQRLAVAMSLLAQCGATMFIVDPFELRLKEGGWKIYRPATGKYLVDANEQTVWPNVIAAYQRAKELADVKGGAA